MHGLMEKIRMGIIMLLAMGVVATACAEEKAVPDDAAAKRARAANYDETACGVNAPIYAYYAGKIKTQTGIFTGVCLDAGSGGGYLGLALAKITDLDFIFLDISAEMLKLADRHIAADGLGGRAKTLLADVHRMPLADASIDLVISRGSIPFWKDPATALKEIYRVLAPGGKAYVGGGRGTPEIQRQIAAKRKEMGLAPSGSRKRKGGPPERMAGRDYDAVMQQAGIRSYEIQRGDDGMWIRMWK